jgi:hypothetical protein
MKEVAGPGSAGDTNQRRFQIEIVPADGNSAAISSQDFGTSR